jgi:type I restriction enzyme S subunit
MTKWSDVALGDVAVIERDIVEPSKIKAGTMYVGLENINSGGDFSKVGPVDAGELASSKFAFSSLHVLYGKLRPYLAKIARPDFAGICSTDILPILPGDKLDRDYLAHFLLTPRMVAFASSLASGANLPRLSPHALLELRIPLPTRAEQRRIAEVLDRAEALRAKRRAALAQLDTLTQAIFLDMFGEERDILEKWPTRPLGELLEFLSSGSRGWAKHYSEQGDLFLRIQNVKHDELSLDDIAYVTPPDTAEAKRTRVEPYDVLLSITADLGRNAVVPHGLGPAYINQHLAILRTGSLAPKFLSAYLNSPSGQRQIARKNRHGVKAGLNFDDIRSFSIPTPPLNLQREFALRASKIEHLKVLQRRSQMELNAVFGSLQSRAFEGNL